MKKAWAAALLWIFTALPFTAASAELSASWAKLFGWNCPIDLQTAKLEFEHDARAGEISAQLGSLLLEPASNSDSNHKLKPLAEKLLSEFTTAPDKLNAFLLAELLNVPTTLYYDADLALKLYIYSAAENFPLAACRAGSMLALGSQENMRTAANYLEQASRATVSEADYQLFLLYSRLNRPADAQAVQKRLLAQQHPAAPALQALMANKLTEQLAGASGYTLRIYALRNLRNSSIHNQKELLFQALERGDQHSSLLLAALFRSQPKPDHAMAINSALLANLLYNGSKPTQELLEELDKNQGLAMPLLAMWQNRLRSGKVLRQYWADSNSLIIDLTLADTPENRRAIAELLKKNPEAFWLSGTAFRLLAMDYSADDFKKLFALAPGSPTSLPQLITELLIAAKLNAPQWQLQLSQQLFAEVQRSLPPPAALNFRKQLLTVLPAAAVPGTAAETTADSAIYNYLLWNLAVDMHTNALLANGKKSEAAQFLQKHHRYRLPPKVAQLERNMVRNFAKHIITLK